MKNQKIKIIIMGYHNDAYSVIKIILENRKYEIVALVLPSNRAIESIQPIISIAQKNNITYYIPDVLDKKFINKINSHGADVIFSISYSKLIPTEIASYPKYGTINLHESLLPKHRGAHPLNWAIIQGDKLTGVTAHFVVKELDGGDIILQKAVDINDNDDAVALEKTTTLATLEIVLKILEMIEKGVALPRQIQDESKATFNKPRKIEDGKISWDWSAAKINNYIRALVSPWPGAYCISRKSKIILWRAKIVACDKCKNFIINKEKLDTIENGKVLLVDNEKVLVKTRDKLVEIESAQKSKECRLESLFQKGEILY